MFKVYNSWKLSTDSWISSSRWLFWISILLGYGIDDEIKWVEDSLELNLLEEANLPLIISVLIFMSISIVDGNWAIGKDCKAVNKVEINVFANFHIGATMQDSSKREKSDNVWFSFLSIYFFWFDFSFSFLFFFFYFLDNEEIHDCSHMMCHITWCHKLRIWEKG